MRKGPGSGIRAERSSNSSDPYFALALYYSVFQLNDHIEKAGGGRRKAEARISLRIIFRQFIIAGNFQQEIFMIIKLISMKFSVKFLALKFLLPPSASRLTPFFTYI
jgi:hypothetical protein